MGLCLTNRASCPVCNTPMHLLQCQWDPHSHTSDIINPPQQREKMRQTSPHHFNLSALNKIFCSWKWEIWGKIMCEVTKFNTGTKHIALLIFFPDLPQRFLKFHHNFNEISFVRNDLEEEIVYFVCLFFFSSSTHWCLRKHLKLSQAPVIF